MSESDWNAEAVVMAQYVAANITQVHRGALEGRQSRVSVLFGNDSRMDPPMVQDEVSRIREALEQVGIRILGFGLDPEQSHTWAMIVESEDLPLLNDLVGAL
jgi:hypothetical protein